MILHQPLRIFCCVSLAMALSGCLGAFEHQPPRYNFVAGGKRAPMLNPGGSGYQAPVMKGEGDKSSEAMVMPAPNTNPAARTSAPMPVNGGAMPQANTSGAPEPSPLYYYEQQQSKVAASDLPATVSAPAGSNPITPAIPSPPSPSDDHAIHSGKDQGLTSAELSSNTATATHTEFPDLQGVPQKATPELQQNFAAAKQKAAAFEEANPTPSPAVDLTKQPLNISTQPVQAPLAGRSAPPAEMPAAAAPQEAVVTDIPLDQATASTAPAPSPMAAMTPIAEPAPLPQTAGMLPSGGVPVDVAPSNGMMPVAPAPVPSMAPPPPPAAAPQEPSFNALAPTPVAPPAPATAYPSNPADTMVTVPTPTTVAATPFVPQSQPIHLIAPNSANPQMREIPPSRYSRLRSHNGLNQRAF